MISTFYLLVSLLFYSIIRLGKYWDWIWSISELLEYCRSPSSDHPFTSSYFGRFSLTKKTSSVISYLGLVHTTQEKFGNAALFLLLGLPSTLIRQENGAIWKRSWNWRSLNTSALSLWLGLPSTLIRHAGKRSFLKTLFKLEECENEVLFLRLGLPSTLFRHQNGAFWKCSWTWRSLKNLGFSLWLSLPSTLIRHENGAFCKRSSNWRNLKTPA